MKTFEPTIDHKAEREALLKEIDRLEKENSDLRIALITEKEGSNKLARSMSEAFNTGDGTYKP